MQTQVCEPQTSPCRSGDWVYHVIALLDAAIGQLHHEEPAHGTLLKATSLLRRQVDPPSLEAAPDDGKEQLLAWQARKVLDHIDRHITSRVLVKDLCALVRRSEAHFSRSFRGTFGYSPHSFVVRRRVELAAKHMLQTEMSLSDIALECGFVDQAHLCKHFRVVAGETPAAWRRAKRALLPADGMPQHGAAHASEQFVGNERLYEIANHIGFDCLRLRPLVRIGGHEDRGDRSIRGDQILI
jgi:AraC family transcriptional regulator